MPALSVLLPCYNAAATLPDALALTAQTFTDFEVIAVDDGSTDATAELLHAAARADSRFTVISQPHAGIIPALNRGLSACRAPLIARMDADDYAYPTRLEKQKTWLDQHPTTALVACLVEGFPPEQLQPGFQRYLNWMNSLQTHADICREIFVESPFAHPGVMFRKAWVEKVGGYQDHGWAEDYDLWLRLYLAGAEFAKVPETLLAWRDAPHRLTRTDSRYAVENFLRAKSHYLLQGPLPGRDAVFIWGAGMIGRRLSKHLVRAGAPLAAFIDIAPGKIGGQRWNRPILPPEDLPAWWARYQSPILLLAVATHGARATLRARFAGLGLEEGKDWVAVT
ncbi:MAG: glycosyltransferase [Anaerolineales bacterium]|nr:glycosyltransferase [Anaerolineales bacterium]